MTLLFKVIIKYYQFYMMIYKIFKESSVSILSVALGIFFYHCVLKYVVILSRFRE